MPLKRKAEKVEGSEEVAEEARENPKEDALPPRKD